MGLMDKGHEPRTRSDHLHASERALQQILADAETLGVGLEDRAKGRLIGYVEGFECRLLTEAQRLGSRERRRLPIVEGNVVFLFPEYVFADPVELGEWAIQELRLSSDEAASFVMELQRSEMDRMRSFRGAR